jgi:hypothetical protein
MSTRMRIRIAAIAGAATLAAGGGVAALASTGTTAPPHAAVATGFIWNPLHLVNGWTAEGSKIYGTPSYAVRNGVLYLRGILHAPASGAPEFAVLPIGARPAHYLWLSYMNFGGDDLGEMEIEPNGDMFAYGIVDTGPPIDPSLAAISFPLSS